MEACVGKAAGLNLTNGAPRAASRATTWSAWGSKSSVRIRIMDGGLPITGALVAKVVVGVAVERARGGAVAADDQAATRGQAQVFLAELFADGRQVFEILGAHG